MLERELFLDSSYLIALAVPADQHHDKAVDLFTEVRRQPRSLITTQAVMLEVADALAKPNHRESAVQLLRAFEADPTVEVVPLTQELYLRGLDLFASRHDKEWALTDCLSFVVMNERAIKQALTTDENFQQAAFTALLRG
jgi:predicted nucleic acid-binding protein